MLSWRELSHVTGLGEVICELYSQELCASDPLHSGAINGQRSVVSMLPSEVDDNFPHTVSRSTSSLYSQSSLLLMRPTTAVLSENLMMQLVLDDAVQSYVSSVNRSGLGAQCGGAEGVAANLMVCVLPLRRSRT